MRTGEESIVIQDLYQDLQDGVVLYKLLEALSQEPLTPYGKLNKGNIKIQRVANLNIGARFPALTHGMAWHGLPCPTHPHEPPHRPSLF